MTHSGRFTPDVIQQSGKVCLYLGFIDPASLFHGSNAVEALPCGSISISRTLHPKRAKAADRFTADVVLPTPTVMSHAFSADTANKLTQMMEAVVTKDP